MAKVVVVGGGAAGIMAAIGAAYAGHHVILLEKNEKLGKKIYITGKGRCNVTNAGDFEDLVQHVVTNPRFLYSALTGFSNQDMMQMLESAGLPLKIERGNRVFPCSDKSSDVIRTLTYILEKYHVKICLRTQVEHLLLKKLPEEADLVSELSEVTQNKKKKSKKKCKPLYRCYGVTTNHHKQYLADIVIIATGGVSYPSTGSTGDGYQFARDCSHTVNPVHPALVPMVVMEDWIGQLQGLSLRNVAVTITKDKKTLYTSFGEMLFTHFGVSGPAILSGSSICTKYLTQDEMLLLHIDLKPALSEKQLNERILRDFADAQNKQLKNALNHLYPSKMIPVIIMRSQISPEKKIHDITKEEREHLASLTKDFTLTLTGVRDFKEAIITQGGVAVKEIVPSTMESRLVQGLRFAGEVLDVDAFTGGYNLQIAWSTGWIAGNTICPS